MTIHRQSSRGIAGNRWQFSRLQPGNHRRERCRTGLRLREALDRGECDLLSFFPLPEWKVTVDDKEASYKAHA